MTTTQPAFVTDDMFAKCLDFSNVTHVPAHQTANKQISLRTFTDMRHLYDYSAIQNVRVKSPVAVYLEIGSRVVDRVCHPGVSTPIGGFDGQRCLHTELLPYHAVFLRSDTEFFEVDYDLCFFPCTRFQQLLSRYDCPDDHAARMVMFDIAAALKSGPNVYWGGMMGEEGALSDDFLKHDALRRRDAFINSVARKTIVDNDLTEFTVYTHKIGDMMQMLRANGIRMSEWIMSTCPPCKDFACKKTVADALQSKMLDVDPTANIHRRESVTHYEDASVDEKAQCIAENTRRWNTYWKIFAELTDSRTLSRL